MRYVTRHCLRLQTNTVSCYATYYIIVCIKISLAYDDFYLLRLRLLLSMAREALDSIRHSNEIVTGMIENGCFIVRLDKAPTARNVSALARRGDRPSALLQALA